MKSCRVLITFSVPAALVLVLGCRLQRQLPSQPTKFVGTGYAFPEVKDGTKGPVPSPQMRLPDSLTGTGDAEVPAQALDRLQGRLVARQVARQAARRDLARQIAALEIRPGQTIGEMARKDPRKREKVENSIRRAEQKGLIATGGNKFSVILTLDVPSLVRALDQPDSPTASIEVTTATVAARREAQKRAEKEAIENARSGALQYVRAIPLRGRETVGDRMVRDENLDRAIRAKVASLNPISLVHRQDGVSEAIVMLDLADIHRSVEEHRKGFRWPTRFRRSRADSKSATEPRIVLPSPQ